MNEEDASPLLAEVFQRLDQLNGRVAELEQRLSSLETNQGSADQSYFPDPASFTMVASAPPVAREELSQLIGIALDELGGEADVGAIRSQLAKNGHISITRSDVNKALYASKNLFEIGRQDNMKPIWKKTSRD